MELAGQFQAIGGVARFMLRIQFVHGLEVRRMERSPATLEPVSQRGERAVDVHPLAQIAVDLLAGLVAVQRLQLDPLLRLGPTDEGEDRLGTDCTAAVEAVAGDGLIAVRQKMRIDHGFECMLAGTLHFTAALECANLPLSRAYLRTRGRTVR